MDTVTFLCDSMNIHMPCTFDTLMDAVNNNNLDMVKFLVESLFLPFLFFLLYLSFLFHFCDLPLFSTFDFVCNCGIYKSIVQRRLRCAKGGLSCLCAVTGEAREWRVRCLWSRLSAQPLIGSVQAQHGNESHSC